MEDADFSDEFWRFVQATLPTVDAAELLLFLARSPDVWWDPVEVPHKLRPSVTIEPADAARYLDLLRERGLLAVGPDRSIQYRPANAELGGHVATLEQAYRERPVTLFRMIYALRDTKIKSFADAFRLTRR